MAQKPILRKPEPLTAAIISYMKAGEERADAQCLVPLVADGEVWREGFPRRKPWAWFPRRERRVSTTSLAPLSLNRYPGSLLQPSLSFNRRLSRYFVVITLNITSTRYHERPRERETRPSNATPFSSLGTLDAAERGILSTYGFG